MPARFVTVLKSKPPISVFNCAFHFWPKNQLLEKLNSTIPSYFQRALCRLDLFKVGADLHCAHDEGSPRWTSHHVTWYDNPVSLALILIDSLIWLGDPSLPHWGRDSSDLTRWRAAGLTTASFCLWDLYDTHIDHVIQWLIPFTSEYCWTCEFLWISSLLALYLVVVSLYGDYID
jgi:hypothetical protein